MSNKCSRRQFLGSVGLSGLALGLGTKSLFADSIEDTGSSAVQAMAGDKSPSAICRSGKVIQPERELPVKTETDVLVVGGGPAGVAAAITAKRAGVNVTLMERYGCFGGLFTGGLVLKLDGTYSIKDGKRIQVARGFNDEVIKGLSALGKDGLLEDTADPTADPEAAKYLLGEMVRQSGVKALLHCWGVDAIMDGNKIRGAVFESKSGRQAVLAKIVIDTSGDGDIFAAAGAEYSKHLKRIGLVHRIGNPDGRKIAGDRTPIRNVYWINMGGEKADAINIDDLTRLEMNYRKSIWESVQKTKKTSGYENVFLLDTASQLGIRTSRLLKGVKRLMYDESLNARNFKDLIGVASRIASSKQQVNIPYGSLLPQSVDGLLVAGRCVSMEEKLTDTVRLIPACFTSGQAAGTAAALSIQNNCEPRNLDIGKLQNSLRNQGAYLGD